MLGALMLLTVLGAWGALGGSPSSASAHAAPVAPASAHATSVLPRPSATQYGGDLTVLSGTNLTIGSTHGNLTYYEGGNITVQSGATLTIQNTTLVFVEFVGNSGSVADQLAHIFHLSVAGTMVLSNSSITTFVNQLDPYPILTVTITGSLQMTDGALAFPGSISVNGSSAQLWLSQSIVERNPNIGEIPVNSSSNATVSVAPEFIAAVDYAPTISVVGGAQATFLGSELNNTFQDALNGTILPGIQPSVASPTPANAVLGATAPAPLRLPAPSSAADALALAATYPTVVSGTVSIVYNATAASSSSNSQFDIAPSSWNLPTINFAATSLATVRVALPGAAITSINNAGVPSYLAALAAGQVSVAFGTATTPVTIHSVNVTFVAPWSFNLTVSGAGSTLTAADTSFDMNWNATPGISGAPPYVPWGSNKVVLSGGARAFLANVSIPEPLPLDYQHQSFVVPDPASSAAFYRWLDVPVRGAGGIIVQGASVQAEYAYSGATSENATVTALNAFATADPALAQYLAQWDASEGIATYGEVDAQGNATLLVASGEVTSVTLPDGNFLGDYHVGVTANPGSVAVTQWFYASVPAYPYDLQPTGANATAPTSTAIVSFPQYRVSVSAGSPTFALTGVQVTNNSTAVGQPLTIKESVQNTGTGTASTYSATLLLSTPSRAVVQIGPTQTFTSLGPGASRTIDFNWTVNGTLVGYQANGVFTTFTVEITWNPGAGSANASRSLTIFPPYISFSLQSPSGTLTIGDSYLVHVFLGYAGNGTAVLNILARDTAGDAISIAAQRAISPGETNLSLLLDAPVMPGTYSITASVVHDNRTAFFNVSKAFIVPSATPPSPTPWYEQTFAGLPLWIWIVIAAAIAAGVGLFLWVSVQKAKGKVVECGECGAMIPETAVACPECGAEFESDRVRCSRCGSTIPGNSAICPECAATLLGRAGEEKDDPERQGYTDFVERFRVEGRKALGDSYSESAFWDWWKRQSTYVPFGQWKMQQAQGSRAGMSAPRESSAPAAPPTTPRPPSRPPPPATSPPPTAKPPATPTGTAATSTGAEAESASPAGMITCSNCHKEIPAGYLVCPFCGAVTQ